MQRKQSSSCSGALGFAVCLAVAAVPAGPDAPAAQAKPVPGRSIEQPGYVVAFEQVDLYARIPGFVKKVAVDLGDHVKSGEMLAELAVPELEQKLKQKQALVHKAQTGVAQAKLAAKVLGSALERSKSEVLEADALRLKSQADVERWKAEAIRGEKLWKQGIYDKQTLDEVVNHLKAAEAAEQHAKAKVKSAEAKLSEAAAQREKADADIDNAEAGLAVAQAEAAQVSALLQYAVVRAPFDGVVIRRSTNVGALAGPPTEGKALPLFTVARLDRVRVVVQIPEMDSVLVVKGMPATIRFQALEGKEFKGTVTRTAVVLDPKARTLRVEIDLENADGKLRPGMYANVVLTPKK